jgi:hypothetical protein
MPAIWLPALKGFGGDGITKKFDAISWSCRGLPNRCRKISCVSDA